MLAIAANARIFFFLNAVDMCKGVETRGVLIGTLQSDELTSTGC
jgi:hypothetical protein